MKQNTHHTKHWTIGNLFILLTVIALLESCADSSRKSDEKISAADTIPLLKLDTAVLDSASSTLDSSQSTFDIKLQLVEDSLFNWGFKKREEKVFSAKSELKKHWWLKVLFGKIQSLKRQNKQPAKKLSTPSDWKKIKEIRQISFTNAWKFVIEEWTLKDEKSAQRWLDIAVKTKRLDNSKPPRVYWVEGNKMYFIMGTAAADWFAHGNHLVELFSGKSRWLIELLNAPLDLPTYKKKKISANSGTSSGNPFYFKPDTTGTYYLYFWFHELRRRYRESGSSDAVKILTYKYGDTIGYYEDTNEELISLSARVKDPDLKSLNLVEMPVSTIKEDYGEAHIENSEFLGYFHNNSLLLLKIKEGKVQWFRMSKLNTSSAVPTEYSNISDLPTELLHYITN